MPLSDHTAGSTLAGAQGFSATHWSVVLAARDHSSSSASEALERLCRTYWYPLYAYIRRRGYGPDDAKDLTQSFFARLLEKNYLVAVDRAKGKFRSFLLASLNHFLADEWDKAVTAKRGGGQALLSLDEESTEGRYRVEPASLRSPDRIYEVRWATTLLEQALSRLRDEFATAKRTGEFDQLKSFLGNPAASGDYAEVATCLGTTPGAVAAAVCRLRQRYRELIRAEIAHTVSSPTEIEEEMRHLLTVLTE